MDLIRMLRVWQKVDALHEKTIFAPA